MSSLIRKALGFSRTSLLRRQLHSTSSSLIRLTSNPTLLAPFHRFSSSSPAAVNKVPSDVKLARVIESEIQCAQEEENDDLHQLTMGSPIRLMDPLSEGGLLPDGFPFEIIDKPGEETIILKRDYDGETIEVMVHMPQMAGEENEENSDDSNKGDDKHTDPSHFDMPLVMTVVKGDGPRLEFSCSASPDAITIDSMLIKGPEDSSDELTYQGPEFSDLDENLQKEFHGYLERRGIKSSLTNFLQEYMTNKDNKEYLMWLKNMKNFVEK